MFFNKVIPVGQLCYLDGSTGVCSPNSVCIDRGDGLQLCTCVNGLVQQNNTCVKSNYRFMNNAYVKISCIEK